MSSEYNINIIKMKRLNYCIFGYFEIGSLILLLRNVMARVCLTSRSDLTHNQNNSQYLFILPFLPMKWSNRSLCEFFEEEQSSSKFDWFEMVLKLSEEYFRLESHLSFHNSFSSHRSLNCKRGYLWDNYPLVERKRFYQK